jgi:hypothetical protein
MEEITITNTNQLPKNTLMFETLEAARDCPNVKVIYIFPTKAKSGAYNQYYVERSE